jgi:hypothetical protein
MIARRGEGPAVSGNQRYEPAYTVRVVWAGGANETWAFYDPGALADASVRYRELKEAGGFLHLSLHRFNGLRWVTVQQAKSGATS